MFLPYPAALGTPTFSLNTARTAGRQAGTQNPSHRGIRHGRLFLAANVYSAGKRYLHLSLHSQVSARRPLGRIVFYSAHTQCPAALQSHTRFQTHSFITRGTIGTKSQEPFRLQGQQSLYTPPHYRAGRREIKKWMADHKRQQLPAARQGKTNTPGCWAHTTCRAFEYAHMR